MSLLAGRRAVVTGGSSGFGAGIVAAFADAGAEVIVADLNPPAGEVAWQRTDVSDAASVAALGEAAGTVDILVNNAGIGTSPGSLEDTDEATFDRLLAVNARSVYLTARTFVPGMRARRSGCILNIASTGAVSPRPGLAWYNATKGWMVAATRAMAIELAPDGVRVNALNPVAGETPLLATFMGGDDEAARARFRASIPIGRLSTPADIGAAALFLCSDAASMITGVALNVDGGRCL